MEFVLAFDLVWYHTIPYHTIVFSNSGPSFKGSKEDTPCMLYPRFFGFVVE